MHNRKLGCTRHARGHEKMLRKSMHIQVLRELTLRPQGILFGAPGPHLCGAFCLPPPEPGLSNPSCGGPVSMSIEARASFLLFPVCPSAYTTMYEDSRGSWWTHRRSDVDFRGSSMRCRVCEKDRRRFIFTRNKLSCIRRIAIVNTS